MRVQVIEPQREIYVIAQFAKRRKGHIEKAVVVSITLAGTTLHNIRSHRNGTSAHLTHQSKEFVMRKGPRLDVDLDHEGIGKIKDLQFPVISHAHMDGKRL